MSLAEHHGAPAAGPKFPPALGCGADQAKGPSPPTSLDAHGRRRRGREVSPFAFPPAPLPARLRAWAAPRRPLAHDLLLAAAVGASYFMAGKFGLSLAFVNASASAVWPPTGLALAAVLVLGPRLWPGILAGAFLVNATTAGTLLTSAGIAFGNTLEALVGAYLVVRFAGGVEAFQRAAGVAGFLGAALLAPMVSATVGVTTLALAGFAPWDAFGAVWLTWWTGDAVGALVVAPLLITWAGARPRALPAAHVGEGVVIGVAAVVIAAVAFSPLAFGGIPRYPLEFLCLPPVMWAAFRFGARGATAATTLIGAVAIAGTLQGFGPFAALLDAPGDALLVLQSFLGSLAVVGLLVAASTTERRAIVDDLRRARDELEERVEERTASLSAAILELEHHRAALAEAQRVAHIGSWEWDLATGGVAWSDEMYRIYGYRPRDFPVTFDKAMERVHPEDTPRIQADMAGILTARSPPRQLEPTEFRIVLPDGTERILHAESEILLGDDGRPARLVGTVQDVTDRRRAEAARALADAQLRELEKLRELDRFKTELLNSAAHELNTPLTPIKLQLELMQQRAAALPEDQRKALGVVRRNVERLGALVQDILEAARLQAGRLEVRPERFDLNAAAREAVEAFEAPLLDAGLEVAVLADGPLPVVGDPRRVHQVLLNLLSNAWKFTPRGGRVVVQTAARGDFAELAVRDTGIGIRPEDLGKLFQPFSQIQQADHKTAGTGLGLFICKGILELHGGRIWAESDGPGRGTTFLFALPLAPRAGAGLQAAGAKR